MKHIIEFDPLEDRIEFTWAINAGKYAMAISEFSNELRKINKYEELNGMERAFFERITTLWREQTSDLVGVE